MQRKYQMTPEERDLLTRTLIGEAGDQGDDGMAAVAHVVMNRLRSGRHGSDVSGVVLAPRQFEPWQTRPRELMAIDPKSKPYQRAAAVVDRVAGGDLEDPTGGATHFLDEGIVRRRRGGRLPDWADGSGQRIGDHTFYAPEGRVRASQYAAATGVADSPFDEVLPGSPRGGPRVAQAGSVSPDDVAETLRAAGIGAPSASSATPRLQLPPPPTSDDLAETARQAGIDIGRAAAPVPKPPGLPPPGPETKPRLRKELQAEAERVATEQMNPVTAGVNETMLVGPAATAAASAVRARPGREPSVPGATFGDRYRNSEAVLNEAHRLYAERNPGTTLAAGLVGNTAMTGLGAMTTPGRIALGLEGPNVWSRIVTGGAGGGALGMGDAAARGENPISGLQVGAGMGVAAPIAGELFRGAGGMASRAWGPGAGPLKNVSPIAVDKLTGALEGETPGSIAEARRRMGPAGFLGDLNTGMTDIAGGLADIPGPQKQLVREAYRTRAAAQPARIDAALTAATGQPHADIESFKQFTMEARKAAADPLYEQWRSMEVHPTDELIKLLPRLEKAGAFNMAEELAGISGHKMDKSFFVAGPKKNFPTAESWDYAKRGLDRRIDQAYSAGDKTLARELINLKHDLINEIEKTDAGHVWKQARQEFASRSAILDQIERGRDTFLGGRSGTSVDELRHELKGIEGPELAARLQGLRSAADQVMGDTLRGDTTLRNKMLAPNNQEKMRLLLGDEKAGKLIDTMKQEKFLGEQRDNIVGGSQTTPKKERINALMPGHGAAWNPNIAEPLSWIPPSVREGMRPSSIVDAWRAQRHGSAVNQLGSLVTTPEGAGLDALLAAISKEGRRRSRVENIISPFAHVVSGAVSGPGAAAARRHYFPAQ